MERKVKCINVGGCSRANTHKIWVITDDDAELICPECGDPLELCKDEPTDSDPDKDRKKRKIITAIVAAVVVAVIAGAFFILSGGSSESAPTGISLSKSTGELAVGENETLQATLSPDGVTAQLKWATSDTTVIKVVDGVVTAVAPGTAKVGVQVVENKALKAFCEYTVKEKNAPQGENATVSIVPPASTTLKVGEKVTLSAKVTPEGSTVSWKSSDENVAVVSSEGKVTALKAGSADITAKNGDAEDAVRIEVKKENGGGGNGSDGTINLGYGRYKGDIKNGQPHGHGTITYTRSHQIVSSKDFIANPGDKFEGEFRDGRISGGIGYWYHNGDITAIKP